MLWALRSDPVFLLSREHFLDVRREQLRGACVDLRCTGQHVSRVEKVFAAIQTGDDAARFANDQRAGGDVPDRQAGLQA